MNDRTRPPVVRSAVAVAANYEQYRQNLREDFTYSCAYCTLTESEATTIAFEIDHYEPQSERPDLENTYNNLMYSCQHCNGLKSDISPPPRARKDGKRFFRPDEDRYSDHYEPNGLQLKAKTEVGKFNIAMLQLNGRPILGRVRDARARLATLSEFVAFGVQELKNYRIDRVPPELRVKALNIARDTEAMREHFESEVDAVLSAYAASPLADPDPNKIARASERRAELKALAGLYRGTWRGRHKS
jgi:hypothetical protein